METLGLFGTDFSYLHADHAPVGGPPDKIRLWTEKVMSKVGTSDSKNTLCSFCGKSQHEVRKLIAGHCFHLR